MKKRRIISFICLALIGYAIFIGTNVISGKNSADDDVSKILIPLINSGKFGYDESKSTITPMSIDAQIEFGVSLALCMESSLKSLQKSKNLISYLDGSFIYYFFKCQQQEEIMLPCLYQVVLDVKEGFKIERDVLQSALDDPN